MQWAAEHRLPFDAKLYIYKERFHPPPTKIKVIPRPKQAENHIHSILNCCFSEKTKSLRIKAFQAD